MVLTQLVVILAVLVAGVAGAALRGHDDSKDVLSVVQSASTAAAGQPSLRATVQMHLSGNGVDVTTGGEFLVDTVHNVSSGSMQAPGIGELKFVAANGLSYSQLRRPDAAGHHWVSVPSPNGASSLGGQDPLAMLKLIGDAKGVETVGDESVHHVTTTHYREKLDPARLGEAVVKTGQFTLPPGFADSVKDAVIDLWIDDRNLPRRMTMSLGVQQITMSMKLEFLDYGKPVHVTVPSADDVTAVANMQELIEKLRSGLH
ncbi:MAG: hypothetical protein QOJ79_319 [Actinomycetota bacterium]|jgi:hypothetical protein|nr:hypothetical protein [Actinomycetota bacterium]